LRLFGFFFADDHAFLIIVFMNFSNLFTGARHTGSINAYSVEFQGYCNDGLRRLLLMNWWEVTGGS